MTAIVLVDCNNFFVSCEQLFDPSLSGLPVCVLSNNDGCIVARSNEAKDLGIPMGMPYFMAKKQFKKAIYLSGNISRYREVSRKIMGKLLNYTPNIEVYSIDEAFLDISGCEKTHKLPFLEIAKKIKREIKEEIGIDVSVGLSSSKTLAKLSSEIAKDKIRNKTDFTGVFEIGNSNRNDILKQTPINDIWGIGRNLHKTLRRHNIITALDFTNLPDDFLKRNMGKIGLDLKNELMGNTIHPVDWQPSSPKSISETSSFREFTEDKSFIKNALNYHCHKVCTKLRRKGLTAKMLCVMLRTKDFRVFTSKVNFTEPFESEFEINEKMYELFDEIYQKGIIYRASGVILAKIEPKKDSQLGLFNSEKKIKSKNLAFAWDKIEQKYGQGSLSVGLVQRKDDK